MSDLSSMRIMITGGAGFLGRHICKMFEKLGCNINELDGAASNSGVYVVRSARYDLTKWSDVCSAFDDAKPNLVIHAAAMVGGIGANRMHPGKFFYNNLLMGSMIIERARIQMETNSMVKVVCIGTTCSYPKYSQIPFSESDIWNGYPEETNAPYGIAKRVMLVQAEAYRREYGLNCINVIPTNLYGPMDNFDDKTSHVIPAIIKKCVAAIDNRFDTVELWGTGIATRDFMYVDDAAEAIVIAALEYDSPEPINIGSGREVSIIEIAEIIKKTTGYNGKFVWNNSYPDGQPRRLLDTRKMNNELGFKAKVSLEDGIARTVEWYRSTYCG